ncbi:hypothetical protein R6Q59_024761 [Mikania micrantha]
MQREQHPPQHFNEEDYKDDIMSLLSQNNSSFDDVAPKFVRNKHDSNGPPSISSRGPPSFGSISEYRKKYYDDGPPSKRSIEKNSSFVGRMPSSFGSYNASRRDSYNISGPGYYNLSEPGNDNVSRPELSMDVPMLSPIDMTRKSHPNEKNFMLHPFFTMKRLDQYMHAPNEELLAQVAKSHYEENKLDDVINSDLRKQMDQESLNIFSKTAYHCLNDKRAQRPNIDQVLRNLEKALDVQKKRDNPYLTRGSDNTYLATLCFFFQGGHLEHLRIPYIDIKAATKNFTQTRLGSGTFATVYRAELEVPIEEKSTGEIYKKWRTVAIKCIKEVEQAKEGFNAEIELLTSCKHPNVVRLHGFCDEGRNMILVYEHASNKSLADYLGSTNSSTNLTWMQRIKIGIEIAHGLNYIHNLVEDEQKRIIHRDIKSENILLGKNWVAKIADFGLSRFYAADKNEKTVVTNNIAGTEYYICPEYKKDSKLKTAVDIYSFGVVLFEILCGKLAYDPHYKKGNNEGIADAARQSFKDGTIYEMVDPKIMEEVDELTSSLHKGPNKDSLKAYIEIAHECVAIAQNDRPTTQQIIEKLQNASSLQENNKDNLQMSFEEIKMATHNFSRDNQIGKGGFGNVFKGEVTRGNETTTIVAKRLDRMGHQGEHQFLMELEILFEYKHENIIGLEGYCNEKYDKILVYEHASNTSLDRHLNDASLTWTQRLKICIDIARGLAFLHGGTSAKEMVIHRDIKSANILLNADWKAKISDFGLSAITAINQEVVSKLVGTDGYVDPQYEQSGFFTEKSDIYSLGVVLFEILYGELLVPTKNYNQLNVARILAQIHGKGDLGSIVFKGIETQIDPESLSTFRAVVSQCLAYERDERPTAKQVLEQLQKSLEFQEDHEIWGPKLPYDYEEILKLCKSYSFSEKKKQLYDMFRKGILLQDDKVCFSVGCNGERNAMISATTFSYRNRIPHDKWYIIPESRFQKVAKMLDISNLMIKIKTRTHLLSPNTVYGVHLVFKFCDYSTNVSTNPMHVDLKYKMGSKTLHAYFAKWRDDQWMIIELYRFLNENKEDGVVFKFLLHSLSPYYRKEHDVIYVEGIEFRAINDNGGHDETAENPKEIKQVVKSNLNHVNQDLQLPIQSEEILGRSENYEEGGKMFWLSHEVNGKKHFMLSAKAVLHNNSNLKLFKPLADSRFQEVIELQPQLTFLRISCMIKSQMLSQDTEYVCYLVFKLSRKCRGLRCPVEIRDLLHENKAPKIVYFRSPRPWNVIHHITWLPKQRKDGWMEVNVWNFNSNQLKNDCVLVNLKLISYEGCMSGLTVCGLEVRPT